MVCFTIPLQRRWRQFYCRNR